MLLQSIFASYMKLSSAAEGESAQHGRVWKVSWWARCVALYLLAPLGSGVEPLLAPPCFWLVLHFLVGFRVGISPWSLGLKGPRTKLEPTHPFYSNLRSPQTGCIHWATMGRRLSIQRDEATVPEKYKHLSHFVRLSSARWLKKRQVLMTNRRA